MSHNWQTIYCFVCNMYLLSGCRNGVIDFIISFTCIYKWYHTNDLMLIIRVDWDLARSLSTSFIYWLMIKANNMSSITHNYLNIIIWNRIWWMMSFSNLISFGLLSLCVTFGFFVHKDTVDVTTFFWDVKPLVKNQLT